MTTLLMAISLQFLTLLYGNYITGHSLSAETQWTADVVVQSSDPAPCRGCAFISYEFLAYRVDSGIRMLEASKPTNRTSTTLRLRKSGKYQLFRVVYYCTYDVGTNRCRDRVDVSPAYFLNL